MDTCLEMPPLSLEEIGAAIMRDLVAERFAAVAARFKGEIAAALPAATIKAVWQPLVEQLGPCVRVGTIASETNAGVTLVRIPMDFAARTVDLAIAFSEERIVGFRIVPHQVPATSWSAPAYVAPGRFLSVAIRLGPEPAALPGTLTLPIGVERPPCVILVHGSGPQDRDETLGPNRPFRDLAEGLATRGMAVLRYDKRTRVHPEAFAALACPTVRQETTDDVRLAVEFLRSRPDLDPERIVVLGHSLGGTLAPRIAVETPEVAAIVILAGAARPLPDIIVAQIEYLAGLSGCPSDAEAARIAELGREAARIRAARPGDAGDPFCGVPLSYWADLNGYDPAATAAGLTIPMLILQGGRDYQVTVEDFDRFRSALGDRPNVAFGLYQGLDHLFMAGEGRGTPADDERPGHVDADVVKRIAAFVLAR